MKEQVKLLSEAVVKYSSEYPFCLPRFRKELAQQNFSLYLKLREYRFNHLIEVGIKLDTPVFDSADLVKYGPGYYILCDPEQIYEITKKLDN